MQTIEKDFTNLFFIKNFYFCILKKCFKFILMEILFYNKLQTAKVKKQYDKTIKFLADGDFKSADVKKMNQNGYYRAKLDDTNRLLFSFGRFNEKLYLLVLEVILNHEY
jgi:hypothetical protein